MKTDKKPARASIPRLALKRIVFIDREIASGRYPSAGEMAEKYGASIATIYRDIELMKDINAPIDYDAFHRGWYYTKPNYRIPFSFSGAENLLALNMAKNIFAIYKDTPIYDAANNLLDTITAPLAADGNSDWYENRIVVPQTPTAPVQTDVWNLITKALRENRILTFEYLGANDDDFKPRRVRPYQLLFDTGVWYLYGYAEERKGLRVFSLCRMKNLNLTREPFTLPNDFDYRTNTKGSYFGVFSGQKKYRFKIAFYDHSVVWVKDRQWADDQKITETDDGIIISFTSTLFEKVAEWVMSRGCNARPLEPELLVNFWFNQIDQMKKMAREK